MTIQVINNSPVAAPAAGEAESNKSLLAGEAGQKEAAASDTVETQASEASEKEEGDSEESGSDDEADAASKSGDVDAEGKPKRKSGYQRRRERLEKLNAEKSAAEQERDYWRQQALKGAGAERVPDKAEAPKEAAADKPKADDFETHEAYVDALTDWKLDQREKAAKAEAQKSQLMSEQEKALKAHHEREKSFAEKTADYAEVLEDVERFQGASAAVTQAVVESDLGPALMYELAKNPGEYERINQLPYGQALREMGKLEQKLASAQASEEAKPKPETKKTTQAPKPIAPVGGKAGPVEKSIHDPGLSQAEWERVRREQLKRKAASW